MKIMEKQIVITDISGFLKEEETQSNAFLAIIKADENKESHVKISPWNNGECNLSNSLSVGIHCISSIEKTDHTFNCCGKTHSVVKVNFKENATISLEDAFKQIISKTNDRSQHIMDMDSIYNDYYPKHLDRFRTSPTDSIAINPKVWWTFDHWKLWCTNDFTCGSGSIWVAIFRDPAGNIWKPDGKTPLHYKLGPCAAMIGRRGQGQLPHVNQTPPSDSYIPEP